MWHHMLGTKRWLICSYIQIQYRNQCVSCLSLALFLGSRIGMDLLQPYLNWSMNWLPSIHSYCKLCQIQKVEVASHGFFMVASKMKERPCKDGTHQLATANSLFGICLLLLLLRNKPSKFWRFALGSHMCFFHFHVPTVLKSWTVSICNY